MLDIIAIFLCITAVLAYLNRRYVGLPSAIGVMGIALGLSLLDMAFDALAFMPCIPLSSRWWSPSTFPNC